MSSADPMRRYAEAVQRICFEPELAPDAVAEAGGDAQRWRDYRAMVRSRLRRAVREALPRTAEALGRQRLNAACSAFLAARATRSRLFRDVALEFAAWAPDAAELDLSALELDLLAWEAAMAWTRDAPDPPAAPEFDFDAAPVVLTAARTVALSHGVWDGDGAEALDATVTVVIWRREPDLSLRWWKLAPLEAAWLAAWQAPDGGSAMDRAVSAAQALGAPIDEAFVDAIATFAAAALERGLVIGSSPAT